LISSLELWPRSFSDLEQADLDDLNAYKVKRPFMRKVTKQIQLKHSRKKSRCFTSMTTNLITKL
jgi:hypothetical protein